MTVPRAVACPRGWFPPATFQLRLRSLRTILYIASNASRNGQESGYFYVTLHQDFKSPSAWTSPKVKWSTDSETRLEWSDIEITNESVHLGLKSILIKVWFAYNFEENSQEDEECLEATWGIHFSGLRCLGTHPPAYGRLPPNTLVLHMSGSYFSAVSIESRAVSENFIPRYLHIGTPDDCQAVKSYDTKLLLRLHRTQRALKQQETNNSRLTADLQDRGIGKTVILDEKNDSKPYISSCHKDVKLVNPSALPSLRQTVFAKRFKLPETRLNEQNLVARAEILRLRISLLQQERNRRKKIIEDIKKDQKTLSSEMEEKTSSQMQNYHQLAKEKTAFVTWLEQFKMDCVTHQTWRSVLRQKRDSLLSDLKQVFPIGDLDGKRPTLRWILLPPTDEIRDCIKDETQLSVVVGDVAHVTFVIARILDVPLRYPIRLMGSTTTILDEVKLFPDQENLKSGNNITQGEFPLHLKNSSANEWSKFEYGLYLLNKNLSQLRWNCNIITTDLRPTLQNLEEILSVGRKSNNATYRCEELLESMPVILTKTVPQISNTEKHHIVIKHGRAAISGTRRVSNASISSSIENNTIGAETDDAGIMIEDEPEIQFNMDEPMLSSSTTTSGSGVSEKGFNNSSSIGGPEKCLPTDAEVSNKDNSLNSTNNHVTDTTNMPASNSNNDSSNLFWNDVTTRAKALSTKPSSFQRPRANHY